MKAVWVLTKLYVQGIWVVYLFNLCCHPNTKDINQKHKGNSSHWWNIVFKTHHFDELLVLIDLHHRQRKPFKGNASFLDINDKAKSLEVDNFLSSLTIYPHIAHLFLIPQGWMGFVFFFLLVFKVLQNDIEKSPIWEKEYWFLAMTGFQCIFLSNKRSLQDLKSMWQLISSNKTQSFFMAT